ncbi:MAG: ATP-grasp fold amidoligase family protein [Verrucomicrobiales bacterium]|nr:ATP-grasp fold amidoligase family protein [Verrucomicrobiales bacterium]
MKRCIRRVPIPMLWKEQLLFFLKLGYWPDLEKPRSFSEKLNYRKLYEKDFRLVRLSDKVAVRDYVEKVAGKRYLIPVVFVGRKISTQELYNLGNDIVIKRNCDSGSAYMIKENSPGISETVVKDIGWDRDYGFITNEWWYREIEPKILVEKRLQDSAEDFPLDYKFFVFDSGGRKSCFIEVIRRRHDGVTECGLFDSNLKRIVRDGTQVKRKGLSEFPGDFPAVDTFAEMKEVAFTLTSGFNFVRVDLYSVEGKVYFGELTFCPSEGRTSFDPVSFDFELGKIWGSSVLLDGLGQIAHGKYLVGHN